MLIGISGKMGSGKNTVAAMIQLLTEIHNNDNAFFGTGPLPKEGYLQVVQNLVKTGGPNCSFKIKAFAYKVKVVCSILSGFPVEKFEDQEFKKEKMPDEWKIPVGFWPGNNVYPTVRQFMQRVGTDAIRDHVHSETWVNALFADYLPLDPENSQSMLTVIDYTNCTWPNWIITDMRFPNECEAIKKRRGSILLRIERPGQEASDQHISETALDNYKFDEYITNNSSLEYLLSRVEDLLVRHGLIKQK